MRNPEVSSTLSEKCVAVVAEQYLSAEMMSVAILSTQAMKDNEDRMLVMDIFDT